MWLFTVYGFFSISVQDGKTVVRARLQKHLEALAKRFPNEVSVAAIVTTMQADYRYRVVLTKKAWAAVNAELVAEQSWANFKNEAAKVNGQDDYLRTLHQIWEVMYGVQRRAPAGTKQDL